MTSHSQTARPVGGLGVTRLVGYTFGAVYLLVGLAGFTVSAGHGFAATSGGRLLGLFEVNGLHNLVHLLVGALLVGAARAGSTVSRAVNLLVGGVYLLVGVAGLFLLHSTANLLALNGPDNGLHFASALVLLGSGLLARRAPR